MAKILETLKIIEDETDINDEMNDLTVNVRQITIPGTDQMFMCQLRFQSLER